MEYALVLIKPDGIIKNLIGPIFTKFSQTNLKIFACRMVATNFELARKHYQHIKDQPFYQQVIDYLLGKYHGQNKVLVIIYGGSNAVRKCRVVAGATNPEEADPNSIRGAFGRITQQGVYENIIHVSSDAKEAKREIKLWFFPDQIEERIFPVKTVKSQNGFKTVWK